jgi:hypothetical protein
MILNLALGVVPLETNERMFNTQNPIFVHVFDIIANKVNTLVPLACLIMAKI